MKERTGWRPATVVSVLTVVVVLAYAVVVPLIADAPDLAADLGNSRRPPSAAHWFGTDANGHDLVTRIAQALRVSLLIATVCAVSATVIGVLVGGVAAVCGGWVDAVLMRLADAVNALPHLLLGIVIVALFKGSVAAIVISVVATHWSFIARLVRSAALTARAMEYVDSAYLAGAGRWHVLRRHLLPAAIGQAVIGVTLMLPHAIWHESALSFLGLGLSPDQPSLGTLLAQSRGEVLLGGWWTLVCPAAPLVAVTLATSGLAAALQRRLAPPADSREVSS
ncbi:putative ABC transporter permease protein [Austwickia chelonae NBRC 105200]|uniref:Putative ABC transporter permease protein n=1 Tax=Austwickia chelonae NBRC 105200 TaxID=1184607 RepID=K6VTT1_9MICO|nr:putative ABC transporter permease protein [Austwickia chelonae NBRC 105200]